MSDLIVRVVIIDEVRPHPNADKLEIVKVGGWQIVSGKGNYQAGQTAVHVPPDAMVPRTLADQWGVTNYLSFKASAEIDSSTPGGRGRVKAVKLRGAPSFGFLAPNDTNAEVGTNLAEALGIEKYEEPIPTDLSPGQMARNHPLFHKYTDIQNLRNYPHALNYGDPLVVTEKLHGTNSRVGWVRQGEELFDMVSFMSDKTPLEKVVGTHRTQRKLEDSGTYGLPWQLYGEALDKLLTRVMTDMSANLPENHSFYLDSLIVFGEIYGTGVQDLTYGTEKAWRVFDIAVNGTYLPWNYVRDACIDLGLPIVPHMDPQVFTFEDLCELAEGDSVLSPGQIKEGIVVRTLYEETWGRGDLDPNPKRRIFKVISSEYLTRKGGTEFH